MFDTLLYVDHAMQMFHDLLDAGNLRPKVRSMVSVLVSMAEMKPNTALLIKPKWANLILEGKKRWEVRGTSTSKREVVALAVSGTKKLWGQAEIKDCILIGELHEGKLVKGDALEENFIGNNKNFDKHQISDLTIVKYRKIYAYVLAHPVRYEIPQPFNYKSGCVIWCSLKDDKESSKKSKCIRATRKRPSCVKK